MGYREISEDRILTFSATPGFKEWEPFFTDESVSHPAKMNLRLLLWILEAYTKPGDVILDPMAGTGSTVIMASLLGRHGIAVELEPRFCDMIKANIGRSERQATLMPKGRMICIQGDAQELSKLLSEADAIVTSPPYSECEHNYKHGLRVLGDNFKGRRAWEERAKVKTSENNIGNLPHGDINAIVTSPPYEGSYLGGGDQEARKKRLIESGHDVKDFFGGMARGVTLKHYDEVDTIVTSPPYSDTISRQGGKTGVERVGISTKTAREYSENPENIGSLKNESYLEAMLQVYCECWKVLKVQGKLIVVIKNFIRGKKVVRLDLDTIKLCEAAGFTLRDRWYFKLPTRSFWRILYHKKYPEVPEVEFEDVLVFDGGKNES